MAIPIRAIPTLTGKSAESFQKNIEKVNKQAKVNFTKHTKVADAILKKAGF